MPAALICAAVLALGLVSCGGGEGESSALGTEARPQIQSGSSSEASGSGGKASGSSREAAGDFKPESHEDSGGGSEQFQTPGGDNSVQEFGEEASGAEFDVAAAALHGFFDARAQGAWGAACANLASGLVESLELGKVRGASCANSLKQITSPEATALRKEAAAVDVGAVRTDDSRGYVLYRVDGVAYAIPIAVEGEELKLAALAGYPLS